MVRASGTGRQKQVAELKKQNKRKQKRTKMLEVPEQGWRAQLSGTILKKKVVS